MIDIRIKNTFFDRPKVLKAVDAGRRRALSRAGAFVRRSARSSIRKRKAASQPGSPPTSRTGDLRRGILFGYDRDAGGVLVGPIEFNGRSNAPEVLEKGGTTTIVSGRARKKKRVRIAARPYMLPALEKNISVIPREWRGVVKGR